MRGPLLACVLALALLAPAAATSLADKLYLRFLPPNAAARAIAPQSITAAETPLVVRYTLMAGAAVYDARAACEPRALSFVGVRDSVPHSFCTADRNAILASYATYRALVVEFPAQMQHYAAFLRSLGLEPASRSTDRSTLAGMANFLGKRLADFFARDGWNSLGNVNREFNRVAFEDYTGYRPANNPAAPPNRLRRPLRWQPMQVEIDGLGRLAHQIHVVPQVGVRVKPLALTRRESRSRKAHSPYAEKNARSAIKPRDKATVQRLLNDVLRTSARLTPRQRFLAAWWDNKLVSIAGISAFYEFNNRLTPFQAAQQFLGEMIAQHDALLVVWREKRRNDVARPRTLLRHLRPGQRVRAFVSEALGVRFVRTEDWAPVISEQPHSEFPSGSATLCAAALEHIQTYHKAVKGKLPSIKIRYPAGSLPFPTTMDTTVAFDTPLEAAASCAESRLWAGVHFRPAVSVGARLGKGIGKLVFEHIKALGEGRVPDTCDRCHRFRSSMKMTAKMDDVMAGNATTTSA